MPPRRNTDSESSSLIRNSQLGVDSWYEFNLTLLAMPLRCIRFPIICLQSFLCSFLQICHCCRRQNTMVHVWTAEKKHIFSFFGKTVEKININLFSPPFSRKTADFFLSAVHTCTIVPKGWRKIEKRNVAMFHLTWGLLWLKRKYTKTDRNVRWLMFQILNTNCQHSYKINTIMQK